MLSGLLVAAAVYCRDLRYDFILDDVPLVLMNQTIGSWRNWKIAFTKDIFFAPNSGGPIAVSGVHYRPLYVLWLMLNQHLFGPVLPWWHLSSLLLHIGVTCLVYQLGVQLLNDRWTATLAALLFAFHPIHVESVSYVTASTDLLAALFVLMGFLSYARFREQKPAPGFLIVSLLAAALAMLSKETAVMFPWLLVAYEWLREPAAGERHGWKQFVWTVPFFAIVGAYLGVRTLLFGPNLGPGPGGTRAAALLDIPLVAIAYLRTLVWPFRLSFFYPVEWGTQWTLLKGAAVAGVVVTAALLWKSYRDWRAARLQLVWMAILLVPAALGVFIFVKEDWLHDRHMYLVSVPFCLFAAVLLRDWRLPVKGSAVASAAVLMILLLETTVQVPRFKDYLTIYASALQVAPGNVLVHYDYALALWGFGQQEASLREFHDTTERWPKSAQMLAAYARELAESGRDDEAIAEYSHALRWSPEATPFRANILYELAGSEVKDSQFAQAASGLREALQICPQTPNYHALLAQALRQQGHTQEADEQMRLEADVRQQLWMAK
jgi:tetratricopeptide (TPR) repeat protein